MNDQTRTKSVGFNENAMMPQAELLEIIEQKKQITIGIPCEYSKHEKRIPLAPHAVELLVNNGNIVYIHRGAGVSANFSDREYSEAGGIIIENSKEIFQADIVLKVAPPTIQEIEYMKGNQLLISSLSLGTQAHDYITALQEKKVTAIAYEYLRDKDNKTHPVLESMSEISGCASILIAAEYLSTANYGKGEMLGGIAGVSPTEIVILGATTAGESAVRIALGLGAMVKVFDQSIEKLRQVQHKLGQQIFTSIIQPHTIHKALKTADVVIGALPFSDIAQYKVCIDSVMQMKPNSVIVDIGIDHGGCFETSEATTLDFPIYKKFNVIHYCVPNIPSRFARTATHALNNIFGPLLADIVDAGGIYQIIRNNLGIRNGIYLYNGILTKEPIGRRFGIPSRDINLLIASF